MTIITDPTSIQAVRATVLYHGLKLEVKTGLRLTSRANTAAIIRRDFGLTTRSKAKLLDEFGALLREAGVSV